VIVSAIKPPVRIDFNVISPRMPKSVLLRRHAMMSSNERNDPKGRPLALPGSNAPPLLASLLRARFATAVCEVKAPSLD
jgi:hypothetical protein